MLQALDKDSSTRPSAAVLRGSLWIRKWYVRLDTREALFRLPSSTFYSSWSRDLRAPWVPSASESLKIGRGSHLVATPSCLTVRGDPIPYFNYISPRLADAPAAMPTLVSSSSSMSQWSSLSQPPSMGYSSSASSFQSTDVTFEMVNPNPFIDNVNNNEYQAPPFPAVWAAPQDSESSDASIMRPGALNLGANPIDASPALVNPPYVRPHIAVQDSSEDFIMRPGALNLAAHPIDSSSSQSVSESFTRFRGNQAQFTDVPVSVSQESFDTIDLVSREESGSLPFAPYGQPNPHVSASDLLANVINPFDDYWRVRDDSTNVPAAASCESLGIAHLALREESASLPFMLFKGTTPYTYEHDPEPEQPSTCPHPDEECARREERQPPSTSTESFDIFAFVHREESRSLPFVPSRFLHTPTSLALPSASPKRTTWLTVLPPSPEQTLVVTETALSHTSTPTSMDKVNTPQPSCLLADTTLYSPSAGSPDLTLCASQLEGSFLTTNLKVTSGKESQMSIPVIVLSSSHHYSLPDLTVDSQPPIPFTPSRASTESPQSPSYPSSPFTPFTPSTLSTPSTSFTSSTLSTQFIPLISTNSVEVTLTSPDLDCEPTPLLSSKKEKPLIRSPLMVLNRLRNRIRTLVSPFLSSRVSRD